MDTILIHLFALINALVALHEERGFVAGPLREQIGFRAATSLRKELNRTAAALAREGVELSIGRDPYRHGPDAPRTPAATLHAYTAYFSTSEPDLAWALTFVEYLEACAERHDALMRSAA